MDTKPSAAPMFPMQCYPRQSTRWIDLERGLAVEHAPRDGPDLRLAGSLKVLPRLNITPDVDSPALYLLDLDRLEERVIDAELPCHAWERGAQLGRRASYSCYEDHRGSSRLLWSEVVDADLHRRFRVRADVPEFDGEDRVIGVLPGRSENRVIRFDLVVPPAK